MRLKSSWPIQLHHQVPPRKVAQISASASSAAAASKPQALQVFFQNSSWKLHQFGGPADFCSWKKLADSRWIFVGFKRRSTKWRALLKYRNLVYCGMKILENYSKLVNKSARCDFTWQRETKLRKSIAKAGVFSCQSDKSTWHGVPSTLLFTLILTAFTPNHCQPILHKRKKCTSSQKKTKSCTLNAQEDVRCEVINPDYGWSLVALGSSLIALHWALAFLAASSPAARFFTAWRFPTDKKKSSPNRFYIDFRGILSESKLVLLLNRFICAYHRNIFSPSPSHGILL